jgi:FADH2 O2-dependent halogenase
MNREFSGMKCHQKGSQYDVVIIGNGIAGTVLATILAKNNLNLLIIDNKSHPKFTIGESTVPYTTQLLSAMGKKYQVPELKFFSPEYIDKHMSSRCGIKKVFGFVHHDEDGYQLDKSLLFGNTWRVESHLYREDIDAYFFHQALAYGATALHQQQIENIDIDPEDGVDITLDDGEVVHCQYVVDASGFNSPLAKQLSLREEQPRQKVSSRAIFTHMLCVPAFEQITGEKLSTSWSEGTLHHTFDGGWLWVIPFDNDAKSKNPLTSVGLVLDTEKYPKMHELSAEQEFNHIIQRFPHIAAQFNKAQAVRTWTRTERMQYSSTHNVGERFCLMSHAADFIDPLYSRGLATTFTVINELAERLLVSHKSGDYLSPEYLQINQIQKRIVDYTDQLVHGSYIAWKNFDVWNAWFRIWAIEIGTLESNFGSYSQLGKFSKFNKTTNCLYSEFEDQGYKAFFSKAYQIITEFESEQLTAEETTTQLFEHIKNYSFDMVQSDGDNSVKWALKNPLCRDILIGDMQHQADWKNQQIDKHLRHLLPNKDTITDVG